MDRVSRNSPESGTALVATQVDLSQVDQSLTAERNGHYLFDWADPFVVKRLLGARLEDAKKILLLPISKIVNWALMRVNRE